MSQVPQILPPHGGYRGLKAYQNSEIIHDATVAFCGRFLRRTDRTFDQMVQAARSGKQNIAEGSSVAGTSKSSELRLIGVARASLEELRTDYEDFLRQRGLELWTMESPKMTFIRGLANADPKSYQTYRTYIEEKSPETAANTVHCVIRQTTYLLDRLKKTLANRLVEEGGIRENLRRQRQARRGH